MARCALSRGNKGTLLVQGPGQAGVALPATLDDTSGFYQHFDAKTEATGDYTVSFQPEHEPRTATAPSFKKEAYRLPTFEVLLNNTAAGAAGCAVPGRTCSRAITPAASSPTGRSNGGSRSSPTRGRRLVRAGFLFSSDARFSAEQTFRSTPVLQSDGKTDAGGAAQLTLDPTIEPTAQPRTYVVEATVTGDDGQQIRNVAQSPRCRPSCWA